MKLFLKIRFIGTAYAGYQVQKNAPTVQAAMNRACRDLFGFDCNVTGCSRTDAGVHALCFCVTVEKKGTDSLETVIPAEKIPYALNNRLPPDISVLEASWKPSDFHARYSVTGKTYIYRFLVSAQPDPFEKDRALHCPRPLPDDAAQIMDRAASAYIGRHDFTSFMAAGSKITDAVRTVTSAGVTRDGGVITFRVSADGFLYHMVRIMAGTLLDTAYGRIAPEQIPGILAAHDRRLAGPTLPPHGLYLADVRYDEPEYPVEDYRSKSFN